MIKVLTDTSKKHTMSHNANRDCYELLAPFYDAIYGRIDADETVRQWWQLVIDNRLAQDPPQGLRLIDIGCGPGRHLGAWCRLGFAAVGLDSSPTLLRRAREYCSGKRLSCGLLLADILCPDSLSVSRSFDVAVSHFNFPNLFSPSDRKALFLSVATLVKPGGIWITDFSEPLHQPEPLYEKITSRQGVLQRSGCFNETACTYDQSWSSPTFSCTERFWFGHRKHAAVLASRTGWRLRLRAAWRPYQRRSPWGTPEADDEVFVDIYERLGASDR